MMNGRSIVLREGEAPAGSASKTCCWIADTPLGPMTMVSIDGCISKIGFPTEEGLPAPPPDGAIEIREPFEPALLQLTEYFSGQRRVFDLPLAPAGTPFQLAVWRELLRIPFGQTRSYGQIARSIGRPAASRAVGAANGKNPLPIVVPCHRVIGSTGSLVGFGGGIEAKHWLLSHESQMSLLP